MNPLDERPRRTIVRANPRRPRPRPGRPPPAPPHNRWPHPASVVAFDFALLASSSFNVVVGAAAQLLNLARRLRGSVTNRDVPALRARAVEEIKNFERVIMAAGVPPEQARAAHYALCATLDDIVLNTPWGAYSAWASNSLVSTFHTDVTGGERFFDLLTHLHKDPGTNRDVLALMYLCLSIGFEGRLRVMDQGALELSRIRESLYRTLRQVYGDFERELSPHWRGVDARHRPIRSVDGAVDHRLGGTAALLLPATFCSAWLLNGASDGTLRGHGRRAAEGPGHAGGGGGRPVAAGGAGALDPLRTAPHRIRRTSWRCSATAQPGRAHPQRRHVRLRQRHGRGPLQAGDRQHRPGGGRAERRVEVVGYTDSQPIHSLRFPSNWELSTARAQAVADLLGRHRRATADGVTGAATDPLASNETAAGRDANRRTELVVSGIADLRRARRRNRPRERAPDELPAQLPRPWRRPTRRR